MILYDFTLTKLGHLRKSTIAMIQEKLQVTSDIQTRSRTHNVADVGLHLDEEDALINSSEEDDSSNMETSDASSFKSND